MGVIMKYLLMILLLIPLNLGNLHKGLPKNFYIKKQENGTYLASDFWLNIPKHERKRIIFNYEQIKWIDYEK